MSGNSETGSTRKAMSPAIRLNADRTNAKIGRLLKKLGAMGLSTCSGGWRGEIVGWHWLYDCARLHFDDAVDDHSLARFQRRADHCVVRHGLSELHGPRLHFILRTDNPDHRAHWAA